MNVKRQYYTDTLLINTPILNEYLQLCFLYVVYIIGMLSKLKLRFFKRRIICFQVKYGRNPTNKFLQMDFLLSAQVHSNFR